MSKGGMQLCQPGSQGKIGVHSADLVLQRLMSRPCCAIPYAKTHQDVQLVKDCLVPWSKRHPVNGRVTLRSGSVAATVMPAVQQAHEDVFRNRCSMAQSSFEVLTRDN